MTLLSRNVFWAFEKRAADLWSDYPTICYKLFSSVTVMIASVQIDSETMIQFIVENSLSFGFPPSTGTAVVLSAAGSVRFFVYCNGTFFHPDV